MTTTNLDRENGIAGIGDGLHEDDLYRALGGPDYDQRIASRVQSAFRKAMDRIDERIAKIDGERSLLVEQRSLHAQMLEVFTDTAGYRRP